MDIKEWIQCVGTGPTGWDVLDHLESLSGRPLDRAAVREKSRMRHHEALAALVPMPGVVRLVSEARSLGVACGIASSSPADWVVGFLAQMGIADRFDPIVTCDMVRSPKPAPDLYLEACRLLSVEPGQAVALEDSVHGVAAAKTAGLFCVAVPNAVTGSFDFSRADMQVPSLEQVDVAKLGALLATARAQARS